MSVPSLVATEEAPVLCQRAMGGRLCRAARATLLRWNRTSLTSIIYGGAHLAADLHRGIQGGFITWTVPHFLIFSPEPSTT